MAKEYKISEGAAEALKKEGFRIAKIAVENGVEVAGPVSTLGNTVVADIIILASEVGKPIPASNISKKTFLAKFFGKENHFDISVSAEITINDDFMVLSHPKGKPGTGNRTIDRATGGGDSPREGHDYFVLITEQEGQEIMAKNVYPKNKYEAGNAQLLSRLYVLK